MENFKLMRPQLIKVANALKQLDKPDLVKKVDELDDSLFEFFIQINEGFELTAKPKGLFKSRKKKIWVKHSLVKKITKFG